MYFWGGNGALFDVIITHCVAVFDNNLFNCLILMYFEF